MGSKDLPKVGRTRRGWPDWLEETDEEGLEGFLLIFLVRVLDLSGKLEVNVLNFPSDETLQHLETKVAIT